RRDGPSWTEFLRAQAEGIPACDFSSVETALLQTLYVLFFIEVGTRRIHVMTSTRHPDARIEVLDRTLIIGRRHRDRVLSHHTSHYNSHRPHRGIGLTPPTDRGADPRRPEPSRSCSI